MKEGREKIDEEFEKQKGAVELENRKNKEKFLIENFSEKLRGGPIVVYKEGKKGIFSQSDKVEDVRLNYDDQGISVFFNHNNWIEVYANTKGIGFYDSFASKEEDYKITKDSFDTILNIMHDAIEATVCSDSDKEKMFQMIIDNFKNKIIKDEGMEKNFTEEEKIEK